VFARVSHWPPLRSSIRCDMRSHVVSETIAEFRVTAIEGCDERRSLSPPNYQCSNDVWRWTSSARRLADPSMPFSSLWVRPGPALGQVAASRRGMHRGRGGGRGLRWWISFVGSFEKIVCGAGRRDLGRAPGARVCRCLLRCRVRGVRAGAGLGWSSRRRAFVLAWPHPETMRRKGE